MDSLVAEVCWALLLIGVVSVVARACDSWWLKPRRIRSKLWRQGVRGPPPSFLYGNIPEMQKIPSMLPEKLPGHGEGVSHELVRSVFPYLQYWSQLYGTTYMYSTGNQQHLYVNEPELLKEMIMNRSLDLGRTTSTTKVLDPLLGDGIIKSNGHHWAFQRKLIAPEFFLDKVKGMVGLMEESTKTLIIKWESRISESKGGAADMIIDEDLRSLSADIISRACFGSSYSQGILIFAKLKAIQNALFKSDLFLGLQNFRFLPTKNNREIWRLKKEVDAKILEVVKNRQEETQRVGPSEKDLLQIILESAVASSDKLHDTKKAERFVVDSCKNIYFAGYETTAITASWCLMLLALHPEWQERVRAEILENCRDQLHHNRSLDLETLSKLKMLTMVIQETLRLYGPGALISREAFAEIKLGTLVVPKGVHIWSLIPLLHRDPEIWGPDATEFKPERFAHGVSEACKYPQAFIPFGYGSRLCLGQTFAMLQLKIVLALILLKYSFSLSPKYCHSPVYKMFLLPEHGVRLLVKRV